MKLFLCDICEQLLFFESVQCTGCGRALAYLPDRSVIRTIAPIASSVAGTHCEEPVQTDRVRAADGAIYRLCRNFTEHAVCNWAVPVDEPDEYCRACRLNQTIPDVDDPKAKEEWHRLELAKHRLVYSLLELGLPVESKTTNPEGGLAFSFMADDSAHGGNHVFTGHNNGLITINIAEADSPFREKMRTQMGEGYRTLLGHFRHEIGHYYWQRLIRGDEVLAEYRAQFGDERADYTQAQQRHYNDGPPADWQKHFISAYASMHPFEDWAETWAHYLHMTDTLETARAYGLSLQPQVAGSEAALPTLATRRLQMQSFEDVINGWFPLTVALNSLSRSMGSDDLYPFVISDAAVEKLRFVHHVIASISS